MAKRYNDADYLNMVACYSEGGEILTRAQNIYKERYGSTVSGRTIFRAVQRLRETGGFKSYLEAVGRDPIPVELEEDVINYYERNPTASLREGSRNFNISVGTVKRILTGEGLIGNDVDGNTTEEELPDGTKILLGITGNDVDDGASKEEPPDATGDPLGIMENDVDDVATKEEPPNSTKDLSESIGNVDANTIKEEPPDVTKDLTTVVIKSEAPSISVDKKPILLVYTTRLDDMKIWWKNTNIMPMHKITANIIKESKPTLKGSIENDKYKDQRSTFSSLKDKINEINDVIQRKKKKIKAGNRKRYERLSRPVNNRDFNTKKSVNACDRSVNERIDDDIPVVDICKNAINLNNQETVDASVNTSLDTRINYSDDDIPMLNLCNNEVDFNIQNMDAEQNLEVGVTPANEITCKLVLKDIRSNVTDIYCISKDLNPTEYYRLEDKNQNHYISPNPNILELEISHCCWYKKEQRIKELSGTYCSPAFIMRLHNCEPGLCDCCCKKIPCDGITKPTVFIPPDQVPKMVKSRRTFTENNRWNDYLQSLSGSENNFINMALTYVRKPKLKKKPKNINSSILNTLVRIEYKESETFPLNHIDYSYLGPPNGDIDTYLEIPKNCSVVGLYRYVDTWKNDIPTKCCCWLKLTAFLSRLSQELVPSSVIKFLTKPHTCPRGKCMCCCQAFQGVTNFGCTDLVLQDFPKRIPTHINYNYKKVNLNQCQKIRRNTNNISQDPVNQVKNPSILNAKKLISQEVLNNAISQLKQLRIVISPDWNKPVEAELDCDENNISSESLKLVKKLLLRVQSHVHQRTDLPANSLVLTKIFSEDVSTLTDVTSAGNLSKPTKNRAPVIQAAKLNEAETRVIDNCPLDRHEPLPSTSASTFSLHTIPKHQTKQPVTTRQPNIQIKPTRSNLRVAHHTQPQINEELDNIQSNVMPCSPQFILPDISVDSRSRTDTTDPSLTQYDYCTSLLSEKRQQYHNSFLLLLNSGKQDLSNLRVCENDRNPDAAANIVNLCDNKEYSTIAQTESDNRRGNKRKDDTNRPKAKKSKT